MFTKRSSLVFRIFATTIALSVVGLTPTSATDSKPQRIISLSPSATETLFAIGAGPQVIAVDDLSNFPTNAPISKLSAFSPNVEALLNYKPDLIILNADATKAIEIKSALEKLKIKVFLEKAPKDLSQVYLEITALGRATGNLASAQTVVTTMKSKIRAAIKSGRQAKKISFFHELDNTLYTATSDTFIGKVYKDFNLTNVADPAASADSAGYPQLQSEYLIKSNPRIIFLSDAQYGESLATIMKRPGWNGISAVSKKSVIALPEDIPSRWGPRLVDFYEFIATAIGKIK
ncbi:MAG: ABC transporter substrate-binding protein [Actinomycetales bacterium]|nr:MAG: ABC transporter substrate-binding protein [Actinomycetales bacterium]